MNIDLEKVKNIYEDLSFTETKNGYENFEIALLIYERISNIGSKKEITKEIVDKIGKICEKAETLFDSFINEELDKIETDRRKELFN